MNRILAISDIHGCYDEFCQLLELAKYDANKDHLILVGDYVDRGPKSKAVVELVQSLVVNHGAIALKGNHDDMFVKHLLSDEEEHSSRHLRNGAIATFKSYYRSDLEVENLPLAKKYILENHRYYVEFLRDLPLYHETENHVFVHAGINPLVQDWKQTSEKDMIWIRNDFFDHPTNLVKKVVFGHTICPKLHEKADVWFCEDKIGIDGGAVYGHQLNCLEIVDGVNYHVYSIQNLCKLQV